MEIDTVFQRLRAPTKGTRSFAFDLFKQTDFSLYFPPPLVQHQDFKEGEKVLAVFLGETPSGLKSGDLLSKMIQAMPFKKGQAIRLFLQRNHSLELVQSTLLKLDPNIIFTLGAYATNVCRGCPIESSVNYGERFFSQTTTPLDCIAIFHPDDLNANPALKHKAWSDLQSVLPHLHS